MAEAIQTLAAVIAIIATPIGLWLAYINIPKESHRIRDFGLDILFFLLVSVSLATLFAIEAASTEPVSRLAVAKMCIYSALIVLWIFLYAFSFLVKIGRRQAEIMSSHLSITQEIATRS